MCVDTEMFQAISRLVADWEGDWPSLGLALRISGFGSFDKGKFFRRGEVIVRIWGLGWLVFKVGNRDAEAGELAKQWSRNELPRDAKHCRSEGDCLWIGFYNTQAMCRRFPGIRDPLQVSARARRSGVDAAGG